jgi:hypothetical protein
MKNLLTSTAAILALSTGLSLAAVGPSFDSTPSVMVSHDGMIILARGGGDGGGDGGGRGRGGDDNGGDNHGGNDDADDNSPDDNSQDDDGVDDNSPNDVSGSGRKKPRIPGGSGCDDPGDVAEHAGCSPAN